MIEIHMDCLCEKQYSHFCHNQPGNCLPSYCPNADQLGNTVFWTSKVLLQKEDALQEWKQ